MFLLPESSVCPIPTLGSEKSDPPFKTQIKSHLLQDAFLTLLYLSRTFLPILTQHFWFSNIALTSSPAISDFRVSPHYL